MNKVRFTNRGDAESLKLQQEVIFKLANSYNLIAEIEIVEDDESNIIADADSNDFKEFEEYLNFLKELEEEKDKLDKL